MRSQNNLEDKKLYYDKIQIKITRFIKKHESLLSKISFIIPFGTFLFGSILLSLGFAYDLSLNIGAWIYLLSFGGIIILTPIYYYLTMNKRFNSSQIKSFEILGTFLFFIADIIVKYIPDFTFRFPSVFGTICSVYPGSYVVGVFTISFFLLMSVIFVPKAV